MGVDISLDRHEYENTIERLQFDLEYLKAHEAKEVPNDLQEFLFDARPSPVWGSP